MAVEGVRRVTVSHAGKKAVCVVDEGVDPEVLLEYREPPYGGSVRRE